MKEVAFGIPRAVLTYKGEPLSLDRHGDFDLMIIGEIVEAHNQSLDWWATLPRQRQLDLYWKQLDKVPRSR